MKQEEVGLPLTK